VKEEISPPIIFPSNFLNTPSLTKFESKMIDGHHLEMRKEGRKEEEFR
jgi:hypothetical protein